MQRERYSEVNVNDANSVIFHNKFIWDIILSYCQVIQLFPLTQVCKAMCVFANSQINSRGIEDFVRDSGGDNFRTGQFFQFGMGDNKEAVKWYLRASIDHNPRANYNLGYLYHYGLGVEQDYRYARRWYLQPAERGNLIAQSNIAFFYQRGLGVEKDYKKALKWYTKAAEQGDYSAQVNVGILQRKITKQEARDRANANAFQRGFVITKTRLRVLIIGILIIVIIITVVKYGIIKR